MKKFLSIKYWIFDLDNTLYSGKTKVFEQVDQRMSKYISNKLNVTVEEAKKIQKNYFYEYNTTLNGMIKNHKIDPDEFLEFVHDIDIDFLFDVQLSIVVEVGRVQMLIGDLLELNEESIIELDSVVGQPLDIRANDLLVARGEVIIVNEKFAVRITDIISPDNRFEAL